MTIEEAIAIISRLTVFASETSPERAALKLLLADHARLTESVRNFDHLWDLAAQETDQLRADRDALAAINALQDWPWLDADRTDPCWCVDEDHDDVCTRARAAYVRYLKDQTS